MLKLSFCEEIRNNSIKKKKRTSVDIGKKKNSFGWLKVEKWLENYLLRYLPCYLHKFPNNELMSEACVAI